MFVRLMNYAMPWLLVVMIPAIVAAGITNRKLLTIVLLLPTLYYLAIYAPLFFTKNQYLKNEKFTLKVMTYNVWSRSSGISSAAALIKKVKPDILLLQELRPDKAKMLSAELKNIFQIDDDHFLYDNNLFLGTFSRFPLHKATLSVNAPVLKSLAQTPSGAVNIYNAHFLRTVLRRRNQWERRHQQILSLMTNEITKTEGPLILGGDFNLTDQTETYRILQAGLKDAHRQAGWGFGFTFPSRSRIIKHMVALPPMLRIDYLFYNKSLQAINSNTLYTSGGSDHMPLVAEFMIKVTDKPGQRN